MATLPYRTYQGGGALPPGIFGPGTGGASSPFSGVTAQNAGGWQPRHIYGRGIGGHPFYSLAAYHQSRAYRLRGGRPGGGGGFQGSPPPYQGGQPPRLGGYPPPAPQPVFPIGPQPIGPEPLPIYYNPNAAPTAAPMHPALALARLLNG